MSKPSEPSGCLGGDDRAQPQQPFDWSNLQLSQPSPPLADVPVDQVNWHNRLLNSLFEYALDAIVVVDDEGNYVEANPAAYELLSCDRDQLVAHQLLELCELDPQQSHQHWQGLLENGPNHRGECQVVCPRGDRRWVEFTLAVNVLPHHHLLIMRDISDRKCAEENLQALNRQLEQRVQERTQELEAANTALAQEVEKYQQSQVALQVSEATNQAIVAALPDFMIRMHRDGTYLHVYRQGMDVRLFNEAIVQPGKSIFEILPTDLTQARMELVQAALDSGTLQVQEYALDFGDEMRYEEARIAPIGPDEVMVMVRDITARRHLEASLRVSRLKYQTLFDILPLGLSITDETGQILEANPASVAILGLSVQDHCDRRYDASDWQIIRPDGTPMPSAEYASVRALTQNRVVQNVEKGIVRSDGLVSWLSVTATPIPLPGYGVAIAYADVTALKRSELALQKSEARFRSVLENISLVGIMLDPQGNLTFCNDYLLNLTGWTRAEVLNQNWFDRFLPPTIRETVQSIFNTTIVSSEFPRRYENEIQTKHGDVRLIAWSNTVFQDDQGRVTGVTSIGEDITDLRRSELALRESEERLRLALETVQMGTWEWNIQTNQVIWSEGMAALMGITLAEFDGTFAAVQAMIHPDDLNRVIATITQVLESDQARDYTNEFRFIRPDGQVRWALGKGRLFRDPTGKPLRLVGVDFDFTARKLAEKALQASRNQYQDLVQSIRGVVWEYDMETRCFTFMSDRVEEMFGYPLHRWLNEPRFWESCIHPEDRTWALEYCTQAAIEGRDHTFEYRLVRADGQVIWVEDSVTVQPIAGDPPRNPPILRGILTDISERKQAEEGLRQHQLLIAAMPEATVLINQDYVYQVVNPTYCNWHQLTESEILGHTVADILGETVFTTILKPLIDRALTGEIVHYQNWFHYPHRGRQFIDIIYGPYYDLRHKIVGVVATLRNITPLKQAELRLIQQTQQEHLLAGMTERIRRSLDLSTLLDTLVTEVQDYLDVDRVLICQFNTLQTGQVIAESVAEGYLSLKDFQLKDPCWAGTACQAAYHDREVRYYTDLQTSALPDCYLETLISFQVRAMAVIPVLSGDRVWGLILAHQCRGPRHWLAEEVDLLKQLTDQISIAIHQSELYGQIQQFNVELEHQVQTRTAELQQSLQFEALLRRISDKVRSSLNEEKILQAAVDELAEHLHTASCDIGIFDLAKQESTVRYEVAQSDMPKLIGQTFPIEVSEPIYDRLFRGETVHHCWLSERNPLRHTTHQTVCLACPIIDDSEVFLGDIWIHRLNLQPLNQMEINLVEQVANQCAIALRQAKLYQAAQAQVTELARLNQLKEDFLSTVSHELRTPISSIKMATQMLDITLPRLSVAGPEALINQCDRYLQILREESQRETDLINNLLALTQADAGVDPLMVTVVDLDFWIPHVTESFHDRLQSHQQVLQVDIPANTTLTTDLSYFEKVMTELLSNACKYSPAGATIQVSARFVEEQIEIVVSNSGVEISPEERDRVFEKFYRIPNQDPWKHGGTGLGLALVRKLVDRLQGTIHIAGAPNQVQFVLRLPRVLEQSEPANP